MPYTMRTVSGSLSDPSFRKINFNDSGAVVLVSTHLRRAWTALPGEDTSASAVGTFIATNHNFSEEERNAVPQNPDTNDVYTPWRREIYHQWNHVFYDITNFLTEVGPVAGHMHPPAHAALPLNYPESVGSGQGKVVKIVWRSNVLVLPAHLEPGVSLRMAIINGAREGEAETVGIFDGSNGAEIWYIKKGTEVLIFVEGEYAKDRRGVAAVLVYGKLITTCRSEEENDEQG